jgi:hypothetical protein
VYVILEGVLGSLDEAPFSIQFVRVPYDVEAELTVAKEMGMPQLDAYIAELRHGIYRGEMHEPGGPTYHRRPRSHPSPFVEQVATS